MNRQETDLAADLRHRIASHPERSCALALLAGYAIGGGLSGRLSFQLALTALEGLLGERLIPAMVSAADKRNGHRRSRNQG